MSAVASILGAIGLIAAGCLISWGMWRIFNPKLPEAPFDGVPTGSRRIFIEETEVHDDLPHGWSSK